MSRDFSRDKREELYRALDTINEREWKPFMVWCGRRADEFGEWAERLGISSYTKQIDHFQDRVLEINNTTRNQIDVVFEEVAETDRRYADILRGHAETVREQVRRVQVMLQAMQSADRTGTERKVLLQWLRPQTEISHEERLERGQRVLRSYLKIRGITDPAEQQEICSAMAENCPDKIRNLYIADCYGIADAGAIYDSIMECFYQYEHDRELACAEDAFNDYLIRAEYTNSIEREFIIAMLWEAQPQLILDWYHEDIYHTTDCEDVKKSIKESYFENKERIRLETIEEKFRNDERADQCGVVCEYLAYLVDLQYICQAEYDRFLSDISEGSKVSSEKKEEICKFMLERREFIMKLGKNKKINTGEEEVVDEEWDRGQIMCALQIEAELSALGYDKEFIIGLIGNMKAEGKFGKLEGTDHSGKHEYWDHINDCIDYFNVYSKKHVMDFDLIKLYVDVKSKRNTNECKDIKLHYFGLGAIQWTDSRGEELLEFYLREAGCDTESAEFKTMVQNCRQNKPYEKKYLTVDQVRIAEMQMMIHELTEKETYMKIYPSYQKKRGDDVLANIKSATKIIKTEYINRYSKSLPKRTAAALRWYMEQNGNDVE